MARALQTALGLVLWGAGFVGAESPPASTSVDALVPGPHELVFANGRQVLGRVLSVEGDRVRFEPFDGPSFVMGRSAVRSARALSVTEVARARAAALGAAGRTEEAVAVLREAAGDAPELAHDLADVVKELAEARRVERRERVEAFRVELDALIDRKRLLDAKAAVTRELARDPDDPDLLDDALLVDFLVHREGRGDVAKFDSPYLEAVRSVDASSAVLRGIEMEMGVEKRIAAKWEADREAFLRGAMDDAGRLYEAYRVAEAREVLRRALALGPDRALEARLREFLNRVEGEYAAELRDRQAKEAEERKALARKAGGGDTPGDSARGISDKEYERLKGRMGDRRKLADIYSRDRRRYGNR